ncbi:TIR domain-containing protein [Sphingosinicella sp.]|uniref:TIR domain-containing protein n=1 Tax=Sphingosinicella sp. TaxID=1917971 RepID=UPI0040383342
MTHDVFISHSSQDRAVGDAACAALERAGHTCWIAPRDIMPGEDYGEAIVDGIRASRIFLLVVSAHSVTSPQVRRETERAANAGIPIIPFRIEDVLPSKSLEFFISSAHWLDAISRPMEPHYDYLVKVVGRLLAEAEGKTIPPLPLRAAAAPVAPAAPARGLRAKPAIAMTAIVAGALVAGVALWRRDAPAEPAGKNAVTDVSRSIFTRRATTKDPDKPVRLRSAPAADGPVIAVIGTDDVFRVAPRQGNWWPAQLANGTQGYVHAEWINVIDADGTPPSSPGNQQQPVGAPPAQAETNKQ